MDEPFFRFPGERVDEWHARLAAMDPVQLSCRLRERRKIWLDMARQALARERRTKKTSQRRP